MSDSIKNFTLNSEALEEIAEVLEIINYRPRTIEAYLSSLCELSKWLESTYSIQLDKITLRHARAFVAYLHRPAGEGGRGLKPRSVNIYICAIRKYFQMILRDPLTCREFPTMKVDHPFPKVPSKEEVITIITGTKNLKHRLMFSLSYGCALRLSEVITLRFGDISLKNKTVTIRAEFSKSRYEETVELPEVLVPLLLEYWRTECSSSKPTSEDWLFAGQKSGTHVSKGTPGRALHKRLKELGWENRGYTFHSLRHAHALHYYLAGADVYQVQLRLRHRSITSTDIYIRMAGKLQERRAIANPMDDPRFYR